jgi:hypothetical protein
MLRKTNTSKSKKKQKQVKYLKYLGALFIWACSPQPYSASQYCQDSCDRSFSWVTADKFDKYINCLEKLPEYQKLEPNKKWRCVGEGEVK